MPKRKKKVHFLSSIKEYEAWKEDPDPPRYIGESVEEGKLRVKAKLCAVEGYFFAACPTHRTPTPPLLIL